MSRSVLPIFQGEELPEGQALSEVFVRPEAFIARPRGVEQFDPDPEKLLGAMTLFAESGGGHTLINYALSIDPNNVSDRATAAESFMRGYHDNLDIFHRLTKALVEDGTFTHAIVGKILSRVGDLAQDEGEDLRSVASIHVTGTPERPVSALIVRRNIVSEMTMHLRDDMITGVLPEVIQERMGDRGKQAILTQAPAVQHFGMFAATMLFPQAELMQKVVDAHE